MRGAGPTDGIGCKRRNSSARGKLISASVCRLMFQVDTDEAWSDGCAHMGQMGQGGELVTADMGETLTGRNSHQAPRSV